MKITAFERTYHHFKYTVSSKPDHSVEVVYRRKKIQIGPVQAEGGAVVGWQKSEEVRAFSEASDWLSRFLRADGSPREGDPVFSGLDVRPGEENC